MTLPTQSWWTPGRILALLIVINLFSYIDRYVLVAVEPELRATFLAGDAMAKTKSGLWQTAFMISYMLMAPLFGWLADRTSRWLLIGLGLLLWSAASIGSGIATGFTMLLLTRAMIGVGEAAYGPAAPALIAEMYPVHRRGIVMSWFFMAIPVGSALGYALGGLANSYLNWRWGFWLAGVPGIFLAMVCFFLKDTRRSQAAATGQAHHAPGFADYKRLLRIPSYVINVAAQTAMTFAIGGLSFWLPAYITEYRQYGTLGQVSTMVGAITAVSGLGATLFGGWLADRLRSRFAASYFLVSGGGMALAFPCTLAMLFVPFPYAWVFVFGAVFFLFFNIGPANTALANVAPAAVRSSAFALNILTIHALGDAISPALIGAVADRSNMNLGFMLVSGAMLVAAVLWFIGMRWLPQDVERAAAQDAEKQPV
ncbi:MFS transporter [Verrucomicrobium sp. BvORR034]|uniref:spinster family MFS transporter n=1 Tax=Verrucomicrobium sp. BvORR034 TaxID=1396418 RepID=UPI000679282C|nr:MFS transporter [Verrucomicrobium sp. BvORR034]